MEATVNYSFDNLKLVKSNEIEPTKWELIAFDILKQQLVKSQMIVRTSTNSTEKRNVNEMSKIINLHDSSVEYESWGRFLGISFDMLISPKQLDIINNNIFQNEYIKIYLEKFELGLFSAGLFTSRYSNDQGALVITMIDTTNIHES